jgi:hypothetical protein
VFVEEAIFEAGAFAEEATAFLHAGHFRGEHEVGLPAAVVFKFVFGEGGGREEVAFGLLLGNGSEAVAGLVLHCSIANDNIWNI